MHPWSDTTGCGSDKPVKSCPSGDFTITVRTPSLDLLSRTTSWPVPPLFVVLSLSSFFFFTKTEILVPIEWLEAVKFVFLWYYLQLKLTLVLWIKHTLKREGSVSRATISSRCWVHEWNTKSTQTARERWTSEWTNDRKDNEHQVPSLSILFTEFDILPKKCERTHSWTSDRTKLGHIRARMLKGY